MITKKPAEYHLGITGLPPLVDAMVAGKMYGAHMASPPARSPLIVSALSAAIRDGAPAILVTNGSPERFLQRAEELGVPELRAAAGDQRLMVFSLKESTAKNIFRHGTDRFLAELDHWQVPDGALVIFDGADDLFTLQDPFVAAEQVRCYRDWVLRRGVCGLLVFTLLSPSSQFAGTYRALLEHFDGAMRLESGHDQMEWFTEFWISPTGVVASRSLQAAIAPNGLLVVNAATGDKGSGGESLSPANDENVVYSVDTTLTCLAEQVQGRWAFSDDLLGVLHASRQAVAATIILAYNRTTDLRQLAQAAHTLRITLGKRIRIVVREQDASLRYQNELLLVNLGVNLVIHRDVSLSNVLLALTSLKGQLFNREIEVDFEMALASVTPTRAQGLLPPPLFVREVTEIIARSKALAVPYALVRLPLGDLPDPAAHLARFNTNRAGDLVTLAGKEILVFFSACPLVNVQPTLARLLGNGFAADFPEIRICAKEAEVLPVLARLAQLPDQTQNLVARLRPISA